MRSSSLFRQFQRRRFGDIRVRKRGSLRPLLSSLFAALLLLVNSGCGQWRIVGFFGSPTQLTIAQAKDLGPIPTNPDILGRDGGYSAAFQGLSVWLYGDTFLAKADAQDRTLISDSFSFTADLNAQGGLSGFEERLDSTGAPTMILPETPAEQAFNQAHNVNDCQVQPCGARWALWPASIVVNPANNTALIFYMVVSAQPGAFNFQGIGNSVALWQNFLQQPVRPNLNPPMVTDHPDLMFTQNEPNFGSASLIRNGTLYAYGCGVPDHGFDKGCRLGKVDPLNAQDRSAWTFYAGNGNWSPQVSEAISVFSGANILSVSWNNYLQQYIAVYSQLSSQNVLLRTAPNPEGPWSSAMVAFAAMPPTSGNTYDAHAHSEYDTDEGQTIFVSYSRSMPAPFSSEVRLEAVTLQLSTSPPQ